MTKDDEHNIMAKLTDQVALNYKWRRRTILWSSGFAAAIIVCAIIVAQWIRYEPQPYWYPPRGCVEQVFDMGDFMRATCDPGQTVETIPPPPGDDDWTVICRCPRKEKAK